MTTKKAMAASHRPFKLNSKDQLYEGSELVAASFTGVDIFLNQRSRPNQKG